MMICWVYTNVCLVAGCSVFNATCRLYVIISTSRPQIGTAMQCPHRLNPETCAPVQRWFIPDQVDPPSGMNIMVQCALVINADGVLSCCRRRKSIWNMICDNHWQRVNAKMLNQRRWAITVLTLAQESNRSTSIYILLLSCITWQWYSISLH